MFSRAVRVGNQVFVSGTTSTGFDGEVVGVGDAGAQTKQALENIGRALIEAGGSLQNVDDGGPMWNDGLLIARRLVETGVRCVTIGYGRWAYHGANFKQCRDRLPLLDQGVSALIQDLHDRGLDKDVSVVVWGDFGRTPRINNH